MVENNVDAEKVARRVLAGRAELEAREKTLQAELDAVRGKLAQARDYLGVGVGKRAPRGETTARSDALAKILEQRGATRFKDLIVEIRKIPAFSTVTPKQVSDAMRNDERFHFPKKGTWDLVANKPQAPTR